MVFADLGGFSAIPLTPLRVLRALLRQMPGVGDKVPANLDDAARLWQSVTEQNPPAVLLDNAANESQIRPVLSLNPRSAVIVTSRRTLAGLEGARRVSLGPLSEYDSVLLLQSLIPSSQRDDGDLAQLAQLVDNVPLALRIAGNRIASRPGWKASDFAQRLRSAEDRLRLLVAGDLAVEAAFCLSYDDLDTGTAAVFRSISVIDGATFDARIVAATIEGDALETEIRLDELVDLGLLEARGGNRYRLHDLLRLFASDRLRSEVGPKGLAVRRDRLRSWLLGMLERAGAWFEPERAAEAGLRRLEHFADRATAGAWIRLEVDHWWPAMRSAAALGHHDVVVHTGDALHWFSDLWLDWGHWHELFSLAVASAEALDDLRLQATHLGYLAWAEMVEIGDFEAARLTAERALAAAEAAADDPQRGWANFYLAWALGSLGLLEKSEAATRASIDAFHRAGDRDGLAQAVLHQVDLGHRRGDFEGSRRQVVKFLAELQATPRRADDLVRTITEYSAYQFLTNSHLGLGQAQEAIESATAGLALAEELGSAGRIVAILKKRVLAQLAAGNEESAENDITRALAGMDRRSKDAYLRSQRTQLEELRKRLRPDADSGSTSA